MITTNGEVKFDYLKALYRRNNFGQPCVWYCEELTDKIVRVVHGIVGKTIISEAFNTNRIVKLEVDSRIKAKRKAGYKFLSEIKDNTELPVEESLYNYLNQYLPDIRTTTEGYTLPMKAITYKDSIFKKCSNYLGQYKINGLRCFISAKINTCDMFKPVSLVFQSCEGTVWNSLIDLEDYLLSIIPKNLLDKMLEEHYILDGEVYLPGHTVNEINHFVKDPKCKENKLLQYWCYDIAIEDYSQEERCVIRYNYLHKYSKRFNNKEEHLNNKERFIILPENIINDDLTANLTRNRYIELGFEGLIMRNPRAEYQYGKRNSAMIKYKATTDGKFLIVDIYPEGNKRNNIPLFLCKNDINEEMFECHVGGSHTYQESCLSRKEHIIGKYMYVEYGERSGVTQVPFHIKTTYVLY